MKLEEIRPGVYQSTLTAHELSALVAGARMSLAMMEQDRSGATDEARSALSSVLSDFDAVLARRAGGLGEPPRAGGGPAGGAAGLRRRESRRAPSPAPRPSARGRAR